MTLARRVAALEREAGAEAGSCLACVSSFATRRADREATPEQIDAASRCYARGRRLESMKLIGLTQEEWDAL